MKFRYKVLLINIIIISLALSVSGFVMMSRQQSILMDSQVKNAVTENNLVQSVIEYSLLDVINNASGLVEASLPDIADQVSAGMLSETSDLFIRYDNVLLFSTRYEDGEDAPLFNDTVSGSSADEEEFLFSNSDIRKKYIITEEEDGFYIYVTSSGVVEEKVLNIITRRNITEAYTLMNNSIRDFRLFSLGMLTISGLLIYIITILLTRPLEKLNNVTDKFAAGEFDTRSDVRSHDEIGLLSDKFNHMADSVEEHIDELGDMIHRRDQFVADFTHEIKTPMTTIIGYADTIRSVDLPREDEIKAASYIFSEGRRLEAMSSHLFDLIYLKDGKVTMQGVNTQALGEAVIETVRPAIEKAGLSLDSSFESASIYGDPALLKTAFINLLDNARKASKPGDEILFRGELVTEKASDEADNKNPKERTIYRFTVQDHGIGIAEEDVSRICDEFYMVDKSRSRKEGGAGLGMSLVAAILNAHAAELKIDSKLGEGTSMIVSIEIQDEEIKDEEIKGDNIEDEEI